MKPCWVCGKRASRRVENAFSDGSLCAESYEKMRAAYARICLRLGAGEEDHDLETMVSAMEAIQHELCRRFYHIVP